MTASSRGESGANPIPRCLSRVSPADGLGSRPAGSRACSSNLRTELTRLLSATPLAIRPTIYPAPPESFPDITSACQMNTRYRCVAPARNIATSQASCANWSEPMSFPDPAEAYCGLRDHSTAERPTSTAGRQQRALRNGRDARMDAVDIGRAFDIHNVFANAQTLTAHRGVLGAIARSDSKRFPHNTEI